MDEPAESVVAANPVEIDHLGDCLACWRGCAERWPLPEGTVWPMLVEVLDVGREDALARPNEVWSYDFMSSVTRDGRPLRILNVVDEHTRVAVGCRVARSIGARDVCVELERLFARNGKPAMLRSDNGREFIAASLGESLAGQGVQTAFIEKGSPQQNPFVERF